MTHFRILLVAAFSAAMLGAPALAADEADGLDDLLDIETPKQPDKPETPKPDKPATDKPDDKKPDGVAKETPSDNFAAAVTEMKQAGGLLNKSQTDRPTVRLQENVISRIDQLISDAKKKQSKSKGKPKPGEADNGGKPEAGPPQQGQGKKPGPPNGQGQEAAQQAGGQGSVSNRGDTEPLDEQFSEWGKLPERVRKELLQGRDDKFSTLYDKLTQRYYKRLAEENE